MKNNYCKKLCNECPFSNQSLAGFLPGYVIQDFQVFMNNDVFFPCHKMMPEHGLTVNESQDMIKNGEIKVCRGYLESFVKSAKMPRNPILLTMRNAVKEEGLSEQSMSIHEFRQHHTDKG